MSNERISPNEKERRLRECLLFLFEVIFMHLAKLALRHNLLVTELEKLMRWCFVQVAMNDPEFAIEVAGQIKQKPPHAAVRTGLTIPEITRTLERPKIPSIDPEGGSLHRLISIVTAWRTDPRYLDDNGNPIDLYVRGSTPSLHQLCRVYARGVPTRPIADALVKNGNAEWIGESEGFSAGKKLRYLHPVVTGEFATEEDIAVLTQTANDFGHSLQQTFDPTVNPRPRFREGYFNDIRLSKRDEAIAFVYGELHKFGIACTEGLKKFRSEPGEACVRIGVGAYSFCGAPLLLKNVLIDNAKHQKFEPKRG